MGSAAAAALVAQVAFWTLVLIGWATRELSVRQGALFVFLWIAGVVGSPYVPYWFPFSTYVAVLDIVLVFMVVKGDVRLT